MSEFIYQQKNELLTDNGNEFFTVLGSEDFMDSNSCPRITKDTDNRILAKKIIRDDGSTKYSIKTDASGKFQNPISMYGIEKSNNFLDRICRSSDKFKEVNMKTFNMYITFLRTKNPAWLHNAEREAE